MKGFMFFTFMILCFLKDDGRSSSTLFLSGSLTILNGPKQIGSTLTYLSPRNYTFRSNKTQSYRDGLSWVCIASCISFKTYLVRSVIANNFLVSSKAVSCLAEASFLCLIRVRLEYSPNRLQKGQPQSRPVVWSCKQTLSAVGACPRPASRCYRKF